LDLPLAIRRGTSAGERCVEFGAGQFSGVSEDGIPPVGEIGSGWQQGDVGDHAMFFEALSVRHDQIRNRDFDAVRKDQAYAFL
jgi:hypothetical protein